MHVILTDLVTAPAWNGEWIGALKISFTMVDGDAVSNLDLQITGSTVIVAIVIHDQIINGTYGN